MSKSFKVYGDPVLPNPERVWIALRELNLESKAEVVEVDIFKGEHKSKEYRLKNYSGLTPALEIEDGTVLSECVAITTYLDNLSGEPQLTGTTALEKGLISMMNKRAEFEVLEALTQYFHHATPGLGKDVEEFQDNLWGTKQLERAKRGIRYFSSVLEKQPFVAGDKFSVADITLIVAIKFLPFIKIEVPLELKGIHSWFEKVSQRPSVKG